MTWILEGTVTQTKIQVTTLDTSLTLQWRNIVISYRLARNQAGVDGRKDKFDKKQISITKTATFSISEMCAKFNVTARTLRFYESKELLFPIRRRQKRLFTRRDKDRLKLILQGKRFGF